MIRLLEKSMKTKTEEIHKDIMINNEQKKNQKDTTRFWRSSPNVDYVFGSASNGSGLFYYDVEWKITQ